MNDRYSAEFTKLFVNRKQNVPIEIVANAYVIGHWSFFINRMHSKGKLLKAGVAIPAWLDFGYSRGFCDRYQQNRNVVYTTSYYVEC